MATTTVQGSFKRVGNEQAPRRLIIDVHGEERQGKCLPGDALVTDARTGRRVRVEDLQTGLFICGLTAEGQACEVRVSGIALDGIKPVWRLQLADGRVCRATAEHRVWIDQRGWLPLQEVRVGMLMRVPSRIDARSSQQVSPYAAVLIAYLLADGSLGGNTAKFTKKEPAVLTEFCESASELGFYTAEYGNSAGAITVGCSGWLGSSRQRPRINPMSVFRTQYGLYGSAAEKRIPDEVFTWSRESIALFLNRYFSCDGWISAHRKPGQTRIARLQVGVCSASEQLIKQLSHLLLRFGIIGRIRSRITDGRSYYTWETPTGGALAFVAEIGFFGDDAIKATALVAECDVRPGRMPLRTPQHEDSTWEPVRGIEQEPLAIPVFDIEVDHPTHAFVVDDVWAHNTHFSLTAPGPLGYMQLDPGGEDVVPKIKRLFPKKELYIAKYFIDLKPGISTAEVEKIATPIWDRFVEDFERNLPNLRTIVIDSATELWELLRLAEFGKVSSIKPIHYGPVNAAFRRLIRIAYNYGCNVIFIHKMKRTYKNDTWNGAMERAGFGAVGYEVQIQSRVFRDESGFQIEVIDCRQNPDLAGEVIPEPMCNFADVAQLVYPDTKIADWS